jgi:PKD repeat protein
MKTITKCLHLVILTFLTLFIQVTVSKAEPILSTIENSTWADSMGANATMGTLSPNSAPTVITNAATNITQNTATLNGHVDANGDSTSVSFQYGLTTSYGSTVSAGTVGGNNMTAVSAGISGLSPATVYHFRAKGTNVSGTSYGLDSTFTTTSQNLPPTVVTTNATNITANSAKLNGTVNANGSTTTASFQYGLTTSYGSTISAGTVSGNSVTPVNATINALSPATTYHFRVMGTNSYGTSYGNDSTFTTLNAAPSVTTGGSSNISSSGATIYNFTTANGLSTTTGFDYGLTTAYGSSVAGVPPTVTGNVQTLISGSLTGLNPLTTYHYRGKASNSMGTSYGYDSTFTTLGGGPPPTVITTGATNVTSSSATLNGNINANGYSTTASFQYGLTTAYGNTVSAGVVTGNTMTPVSAGISGLSPATAYHFRAVGTNVNGTAYGNDSVFTSLNDVPTVSTLPATNITKTSATLNGTVNPNGATATVTFEYGITSAYGSTINATPYSVSGNTTWSETAALTGLDSNTVYHYRIRAVNSLGTSYGADVAFTTLSGGATPPAVITTPATSVTSQSATLNGLVNANGNLTSVSFQYGLTTGYGNSGSAGTVNGNTMDSVYLNITGLSPSTLYHFRVVGSNIGGTAYGADLTFTTSSSGGCQAVMSYNQTAPLTVQFYNNSTAGYTFNYWTFGDGSISYDNNPLHVYATQGTYPVMLMVYYAGTQCADSVTEMVQVTDSGTSCQAAFTYVVDSANYNTIHFIDLSTGNILNWFWNFGDDSTSALENPVHTFPGPGTYNVCLSISGPYCLNNTCQEINVGSVSNCISYFTYSASGLDVNFSGHLFSGAPATYNWTFGDGQTGQGQTILHHYSVSGVYYVMLNTVDSADCQYNSGQSVAAGDSAQYYQIYGQVFAGGIPITTGQVTLFSVDTTSPYFPLIAMTPIDSTGVYYFGLVPNGNFYLYATPTGNINYLPTYYGDVLDWEEATIIHIGQPENPYNVNLIPAEGFQSGNGTINGQIHTSGLKTTILDKVTLLLMNADMQAGKSVHADVDGSFTFTSLAYGTYYLRAEMAGVKSDVIMVILSATNPSCNITLTFEGVRILGIKYIEPKITSVNVYPNPVNDELHITVHLQSSEQITAELLNPTGQTMIKITRVLSPGETEITIPAGSILPGLYLLRITSDTGLSVITKIIRQ